MNPNSQQINPLLFSQQVNSVAFSADGQLLSIAWKDETIKLWQVATGTEICTFTTPLQINSVALSSDGQLLAIGDLRENKVPTGEILNRLGYRLKKHKKRNP